MKQVTGFSLIELVIVIIIIGILAIIPFFNFPSMTINLDGQAQQVAGDILYTQSLSMTKAQRYRIVFNTGAGTYQVLNTAGTVVLLPSGKSTITLGSGMTFGTFTNLPNNLIEFNGQGIPYAVIGSNTTLAGNASIRLQSGGNTKTITILPVTGQVSIS